MRSLSLAAVLLSSPFLFAQQTANVGQKVPDVTFPEFLNGDGRQKLSDFYGQVVVIDRWGTRCGPCIGTAVPNAIKHDHELKEQGVVTILIECQGSDQAANEAFLLKNFPDNDCFATTNTNLPVPPSGGLPYCVVIGVDGTLLWTGNPAGTPKAVEDTVHAELEKVKKGWGATPAAKKFRAALFGKNDLAAAAALLATMPEGEERTQLQGELDARYATRKASIAALQDKGEWLRAQQAAKALQKSVGTHATWAGEVQPLVAAFDAPENKLELAQAKKLEKVVKQLRDKKTDGAEKALLAIVKDGENTKTAARCNRLLAALRSSTGG